MISTLWAKWRKYLNPTARKASRKGHSTRPERARLQPRLELLEDRVVPTAGALDPTFGSGGKVTTAFPGNFAQANALVELPDASLIAVGQSFNVAGSDFALAKYQPNGALDPSFGSGGLVTTDFFGGDDMARAVALLPGGQILVAGTAFNGTNGFDFALARYNANGTLDSGFGLGGIATTDFFGGEDQAFALAVQSNGQIVVAGYAFNPSTSSNDFALARYNANGTPDLGFGPGGVVTTDFAGGDDRAEGLVIQSNGMIVAAGSAFTGSSSDFAVARYDTFGHLDSGFGSGGLVTTDFTGSDDLAHAVVLGPSGQIILGGQTASPLTGESFALAQYDTLGHLDGSFGTGGLVVTPFNGIDDEVRALGVQADGKVVATGFTQTGSGYDFALAQYTTAGLLDTTFGPGSTGKVTTDFGGSSGLAYAGAILPRHGVVVAGVADNGLGDQSFALARYQGISDTSVVLDGSGNLTITDVAPVGKNDNLILTRNGSNLRIHDPDNALAVGSGFIQIDPNTVEVPLASITGQFTINTLGGSDTVTVDYSGGDPLPASGLNYDGGTSANTLMLDASGLTVKVRPGALTVGDPQTVRYTSAQRLGIHNAAAVNTIPGPDTADRAGAFTGLTADERFVQALYLDALGRPGSRAELDVWAALLDGSDLARARVAAGVNHSLEAQDRLVKSWYATFLGRQAQGGEELGWVSLLQTQSEEQVLSRFLGDPGGHEFYDRAQGLVSSGTSDERYVQALYRLLLGRTGTPAELAGWVANLPQLGRQGVALGFLSAQEFREDLFEAYYNALLFRPGDQGGLNAWVLSGLDAGAVRTGLEATPEFFTGG
jgi:uncharacterized delta-60 repeat protein